MPPTTLTPAALLDEKVPLEHRKHLIAELCHSESKQATRLLEAVLKSAARSNGRQRYEHKTRELEQALEALESGAQRPGVFAGLATPRGSSPARAHVRLQDGTAVYPVVLDSKLARALRPGDCVLLSGRGEAVLGRDPHRIAVGEEARLEDAFGDRVEVSLRGGDERYVLQVTDELRRRIEAGAVPAGSRLLVCLRQAFAFDVVPGCGDEDARYRFLSREEVPDVVAERDIGDPPGFIERVAEVCRREMLSPERRRKYGLRRCLTYLLTGVSGSGKTLSVSASIRRIYTVMSEVTGIAVADLPPRVIRLRMSVLLSMWLGESDKNADRLVDEIVRLADRTVTGPDGVPRELPVIVVLEELDGIARRRGVDHDGVYDRIQTTLLQRLDHTANRALRDRLVVIFATTNVPHLIDPAWIRRVGGRTFGFGRLRRRGFAAVLGKHLAGRPLAGGETGSARADRVVADVTAALYGDQGPDAALVELQLAGTATPCRKHRRDFLTGSVVDRAVQQAAEVACDDEETGTETPGITGAMLLRAIDDQVQAVVRGLTPANAAEFVDLPQGARVANVRGLDPPAVGVTEMNRGQR